MSEYQATEATMAAGTPETGAPPPPTQPPATPAAGMWQPSQGQMFDPRRKSPLLAAAVSVVPGVGQLYIGYYVRGFTTAATFLTLVVMANEASRDAGPFFAMSAMFVWVFNIIDAGRMAALYNHAAAGTDVMEMPKDFKLPKMGGSIIGGAALLLFGGISLSNTAFNYQLDWLEDWWPVFPLALGVYLFARGAMDIMGSKSDTASKYRADDGDSFAD